MDEATIVAVTVAIDDGEGLRTKSISSAEASLYLLAMSLPLLWGLWDLRRQRRRTGRR